MVKILQLIAAELVTLTLAINTNERSCKMVVHNAMPVYLNQLVWDTLYLIENENTN